MLASVTTYMTDVIDLMPVYDLCLVVVVVVVGFFFPGRGGGVGSMILGQGKHK